MTRILILGAAPLPFEPLKRQYAANLRTWHFTRPLLDDGHAVRLIGCRLPGTYPAGAESVSSWEVTLNGCSSIVAPHLRLALTCFTERAVGSDSTSGTER